MEAQKHLGRLDEDEHLVTPSDSWGGLDVKRGLDAMRGLLQ